MKGKKIDLQVKHDISTQQAHSKYTLIDYKYL